MITKQVNTDCWLIFSLFKLKTFLMIFLFHFFVVQSSVNIPCPSTHYSFSHRENGILECFCFVFYVELITKRLQFLKLTFHRVECCSMQSEAFHHNGANQLTPKRNWVFPVVVYIFRLVKTYNFVWMMLVNRPINISTAVIRSRLWMPPIAVNFFSRTTFVT